MEAHRDGGPPDPPRVPEPAMPLGERAEMLGSILTGLPDGVVALHPDGTIAWLNPAAADLFGRRPEDLLGEAFSALLPEECRAEAEQMRERALAGGQTATALVTRGLRRGRTFDLSATLGVRREESGRPLGTDLVLRDVTETLRRERERTEAAAASASDLRDAALRLASQEAFFQGLHREASDVTFVTDPSGALRYVTPSVTQVLGYETDKILNVLVSSLVHADDLKGQEDRRRRVLDVPGARDTDTVRFQDAEGRWRWFETTATNCVADPDIAGIVINLREVTPEIQAQQALRESEARYRAIAETAQEGILALSPEGDILFANERLAQIAGLSMEQVYALGRTGMFAPAEAAQAAGRRSARQRRTGPERSDIPYRHPDGSERVLYVSASALTAVDGSVLGSLAMVSDVTEQRAAEETLRRQALHDSLTGLPNRLLFVDRLTTAAARQGRADDRGIAVLFLDLDHFKRVNDVYGHQTGDRLLVGVAARLEQAVRATDTVARLGGDEFAVICEGTGPNAAAQVASRIQRAFRKPVDVEGESFDVGVSIGLALSPPHEAGELLRLADMAMYQAKVTDRGRVVTYDPAVPGDATRRLGEDLGRLGEATGGAVG